jgi:multidrug efflux pump subunit AcrA (membrane-fusion protein)
MKKKWIAAFIAAGVLLLGGVTVYAVKTSSQSTVKVVSVSDMSGGGGWSDNSLSGNITSDVSQNIYLADSQKVKKIYVKEGDTVKVGDDLLTYDMTLENLDLEMKKLEKQGIELNIEKANREITKLKNTKPSSDNGNEDPGLDIPEDPGEEPEDPSMEPEEPAEAYQELTAEAEPYMGEGTVEEPYHFLCAADGAILGSFLNRMAEEQCFFVIEVREGDVSNGELLKIWGQKITEDDFQVADTDRFQVNLEKETDDSDGQLPEDLKAAAVLEKGASAYQGDGTEKKPLTYLVKKDGIVKGSFFLERKEDGKYFRIEVREENGDLIKAWEQNGADGDFAADVKEDGEYLVDLSKKQSGETPGEPAEPTDPSEPTKPGESPEPPEPSNPEEKPTEPSVSPEVTPGENPEPTPEDGTPQETAEQENTVDGMSTKKSRASIRYLTVTSVMGSGSRKVISTDTVSDTTGSGDAGTSYGGTAAEIQQQIKDKEKEIRDYQLDIKETNLEIKDIQKKLNNQTIKSTLNGVVKTVGDPEKESNDGKPLIQVVSSEGLYVQGTVSESKMNKLKVGATLSGYSYDNGVSFTAEVREISPYPSDNGQDGANASSYPFTAYIADASGLSNNSWAELTLLDEGDGQGQGIYLEKPFVRTENGQYYVMKDDGTGHLTKQIVQVGGIQYGSSYQITGGLSMDDKITFPYGKDVREGAKTEEGTLDDLYNY